MKAILVIDMPQSCKGCPCNQYNYNSGRHECGGWLFYSKNVCHMKSMEDIETKPNWCPLKPLPDKIEQGYPCDTYDEGYSDGWDKCLDEILGEEK